jgi:hypothetical protein
VSCFCIGLCYILELSNYQNSLFVLHDKWCVYNKCSFFLNIYRYESIIATLCESLDTLDEPEAKVLVNANLIDLLFFRKENLFYFCSLMRHDFFRHQ